MNEWVWSNGGMILTGKNWSVGSKTFHCVNLSAINPKWTSLGLNLGLCVERLTADHMSHGMAQDYFLPCERPDTYCTGGWVAPEPILMSVENLAPTWVETLNCSACTKSLCHLCYCSSQKEANATHKNILCIIVLCLLTAEYSSVDSVMKLTLQNVAGNHVDCEKVVKAHLNNWCNFQHSLFAWVTVQRCVSIYAYVMLHVGTVVPSSGTQHCYCLLNVVIKYCSYNSWMFQGNIFKVHC
jgi:hypothetical protein